jgi:hypothetical protein
MFRPINSDDRTRFIPPPEHVRQSDPAHSSGTRDFGYEVERIQRERKEHHHDSYPEDSFERSEDEKSAEQKQPDDREQLKQKPESEGEDGHVDMQA